MLLYNTYMANAQRDNNNVPTIIGVSSSDGSTIYNVKADPSTHGLKISDGTTGTDFGNTYAGHDDNGVTTLLAVSSVDGTTPVELYVEAATGSLLIKNS